MGLFSSKWIYNFQMPRYCNTQLARNLRNHATVQERRLWYQFLSKFPIRFHRQKIIGNYIVDFYCHRAKLIIEIDGGEHFKDIRIYEDNDCTEYLRSIGLEVIRFSNEEVDLHFGDVFAAIPKAARVKGSERKENTVRQEKIRGKPAIVSGVLQVLVWFLGFQ